MCKGKEQNITDICKKMKIAKYNDGIDCRSCEKGEIYTIADDANYV